MRTYVPVNMLLILKVCDRSQAVDQDHLRGSRGGQGFFSALSLQTRSGGFLDRMGRLLDDIFGESEQIDKARGKIRNKKIKDCDGIDPFRR